MTIPSDALYLRTVVLTIVPITGSPKIIDGLRITFGIEKTNEPHPNTAQIEIYNLSEHTRSQLEGKGTRVLLEAGYQQNIATVFQGNVTKVVHKIAGPDIITTIEGGDGDNVFRNARIDRGFPPGTSHAQIFDDLANAMQLPMSAQVGIPQGQFAHGLTLSGYVRDHLDYLTDKDSLEWSIQDETLQIVPRRQSTVDAIVVLSPTTGLVGSPNKTKDGVEFTSLLQPRLRPGRRVQVDSRLLQGLFKVRKVTHKGDAHRGDFLSVCEATVT